MNIKGLPSEVITLICSFGYPEYKEHMKEICYQINNYTGTGLLEYNLNFLDQEYDYLLRIRYIQCMQEFLTYAVDEEILQDLFKQCTKCCCCSKHGHNRPMNYYTDEVSIGESFNTYDCKCYCRHMARHIKRVILEPCRKNDKKNRKCRRKSTFNIQFISSSFCLTHQLTQNHHVRAQFHQENLPILP